MRIVTIVFSAETVPLVKERSGRSQGSSLLILCGCVEFAYLWKILYC